MFQVKSILNTKFGSTTSLTTDTSGRTCPKGCLWDNARWYDPTLGRFAQADTIVPGGVQGLDRYAYVNNNPLRYTDPTGHVCSDPEDDSGFCEGSANVKTKVGNSMVAGNGETHYGDCGRFGQKECRTSTFGPFAPPEYGPPAPGYGAGLIGPPEPAGEPNDLVYPWELNRLDGIGLRMVDISGWLPNFPLLGGGLSVDLVYNLVSGELSLLPSGYGMGGIGAGGADSPSLVLVYDAPNNDALTWGSGGGQGNITNGIGIKASYSSSQTKGETGQYAQVYTIGPSFGVGGSLSGFYNFTPWNLKIFP